MLSMYFVYTFVLVRPSTIHVAMNVIAYTKTKIKIVPLTILQSFLSFSVYVTARCINENMLMTTVYYGNNAKMKASVQLTENHCITEIILR